MHRIIVRRKAGPNRVASRQPRTADGKFIQFGGFAFSKRNQKKPAGASKNKFASALAKRLGGKTFNRADYRTMVSRFRAIWQARQRRDVDESTQGAGGLASKVNKLFGKARRHKEATLTVNKETSRWRLIASTPYGPDKDGQWVTEKALKAWAEAHPDAGNVPLAWWHLYDWQNKLGITLGRADKAYYTGDALVMEGAFTHKETGEELSAHTTLFGSSIGFEYKPSTLINGTDFTDINIYEVSLLPKERASAPFTRLEIGA